ncbi:tetratricopeptide repeat protein [Actibacterium ureilyticum]|uniref:tetratricopeptide repeat protein n=1 Tax=Actibacterium ureilyticum TaxID=1590614 RepID=UPI000BAB1337|nr:tetratricopeptide repeat protein [Actibacterium ureilyticum]
MTVLGLMRIGILSVGLSVLAACDSAEDRAEKHFEKGMELLQAGDTDRALVEFRNVFKLNGAHAEARKAYARAVQERGQLREAFGQYLRLVEQYPDDLEGRRALAELGIRIQNWAEVERHGAKAIELAPDDPRVQVIAAAMEYRRALQDDDGAARRAALADAIALKAALPDSQINQSIIIDGYLRDRDFTNALAEVDAAIAGNPDELPLYRARLQILEQMQDRAGIESQLRQMVERFPDDTPTKSLLIRYLISLGDLDSAESFLRAEFEEGVANDPARITLIQFLLGTRTRDAARAQLDAFIAEGTNTDRFRTMRATMDFEDGQREAAIAALDDILSNAPESDQKRDFKVIQAQFLLSTGNEVGARKLVEEVLQADPTMVAALKLRANWLIDEDKADEAINVLRTALDQSPDDPTVMTLMARAHQRNGNHELSGEMLSLAVEASNNAPEESLRYAAYLLSDNKPMPAESILVQALRLAPDDPQILSQLGRIYVQIEDWGRAQQIETTLRRIGTDQTVAEADGLKVALLNAQERTDDAIALLESLATENTGHIGAQVTVVRSLLLRGDTTEARQFLNGLLADQPDEPLYRFLDAAIMVANGDVDGAEGQYRALLDEEPKRERVWMELIRLLAANQREDEAEAALDEALQHLPEGRDLLWTRASQLERDGDTDAAIEIYERLYAQNSSTSIVANNLASLLVTTRQDDESLARAYTVARRLRDTEFPPFQDTYGWISYRRGDFNEAVRHLEPAARGLPRDALVQYHLGMAYLAVNRRAEALTQLQHTLELAGDDPRPQFQTARDEVERLSQGE